MTYIRLTPEEQIELKRLLKESPSPRIRARAQALLLSNDGYPMNELAKIGFVDRETIYNWFRRWKTKGLAGLSDLPRSGRKPILDSSDKKKSKA